MTDAVSLRVQQRCMLYMYTDYLDYTLQGKMLVQMQTSRKSCTVTII